MKIIKTLVACAALVASTAAFATPVNLLGPEAPNLQTVINNLYNCATCSNVSQAPDVNLNQVSESGQFQIEASGGSVSTMIIEVAGNAGSNTFGIYDLGNPSTYLQLFSGASANGGQAFLSVTDTFQFSVNFGASVQFSGSGFGYYLGTASGPMFYSQESLNGGADQLVVYKGDGDTIKLPTRPVGVWGSSSYILAWEDGPLAGSDKDYQDMVVYVESISVPEPGSLALLGLGLIGLAATARRKLRG